ncbi:oligosaccharide flippase family protein [Serratia sp. Tan611]|uniref:oligosaccharide flippase family protein n=1 Tax=Serratia sp. Tan611 TaxID=2773264 RepID=UPI0019326728|nr:oligosaccharide flippase family protein [Serratia sp. Tan611]CAE1150062.1 Membrane protein involved in the export of O-antigen and teichoic acid [Serratia sp. Tan611]
MNVKKISLFAIGPLGAAIIGFITLPLMTWLYSTEDIGRVGILNIAISFVVLLFSLGMDQAYVRQYHEEPEKSALLKVSILPGLIILLVTFSVLFFSPFSLSYILFELSDPTISVLCVLILLACFISRFLSLILRMQERGLAYSLSQVLPKLMILIVIGYFSLAYNQHAFIQLILANVVSYFSVLFILLWTTRHDWLPAIKERFDSDKSLGMIKFGFPLILGSLAFWGVTAMDRVFLRTFSTFEQLAIFTVAAGFSSAAGIVQSVFSTIWAPMVYKVTHDKEQAIHLVKTVSKYMLMVVVIFFSLGGLFSWVVDWFLPENYRDVKYIVIACLGFPLLYTLSEVTVVGIGISRRTIYSMLASSLALLVNLGINYYMVPKFGAAGAAVSTCITFWLFLILRTEFSIITWSDFPRMEMYFFTGLCVIGASLGALFGDAVRSELVIYWLLVLALLIVRNWRLLAIVAKKYVLT